MRGIITLVLFGVGGMFASFITLDIPFSLSAAIKTRTPIYHKCMYNVDWLDSYVIFHIDMRGKLLDIYIEICMIGEAPDIIKKYSRPYQLLLPFQSCQLWQRRETGHSSTVASYYIESATPFSIFFSWRKEAKCATLI